MRSARLCIARTATLKSSGLPRSFRGKLSVALAVQQVVLVTVITHCIARSPFQGSSIISTEIGRYPLKHILIEKENTLWQKFVR